MYSLECRLLHGFFPAPIKLLSEPHRFYPPQSTRLGQCAAAFSILLCYYLKLKFSDVAFSIMHLCSMQCNLKPELERGFSYARPSFSIVERRSYIKFNGSYSYPSIILLLGVTRSIFDRRSKANGNNEFSSTFVTVWYFSRSSSRAMIALRHHFRGVAPHSVLLHGWSLMSNSTCTQCVIPLQTNHFEALKILPFCDFLPL